MYELVAIGAYPIVALDAVLGRILIEMIIYGIAPLGKLLFSP